MEEHFEIEKVLNAINFSQGREKVVWEKIVERLSYIDSWPLNVFDNVGGGISHFTEYRNSKKDK